VKEAPRSAPHASISLPWRRSGGSEAVISAAAASNLPRDLLGLLLHLATGGPLASRTAAAAALVAASKAHPASLLLRWQTVLTTAAGSLPSTGASAAANGQQRSSEGVAAHLISAVGNLLASAAEHSDGAAPVIGGQPSGGFAGPSLAAPVETAVQGVSEPGSGAAPVMLPAAQLAALWSAANGTLLRAASDSVPMVSAAAIEALTAPCAGGPRPWAVLAGSDREAARAAVQAAAKHDTVSLRATAARAAGAFAACSPPNTASDATAEGGGGWATVVVSALRDGAPAVRVAAACALAAMCGSLRLDYQLHTEPTETLPSDLLLSLLEAAAAAARDSDKVACHAIRAVGHLLVRLPPHAAGQDASSACSSAVRSALQALERTLRGGSPKLQWNAAAAASRLLGNPAVVAALPPAALTAVVRSAAAVVGSSGNLKACTQAAAVLEAAVMLQRCGTQECLQRGKFLPVLQESLAAVQVRLRACDGTPLATEGPSMQSSTGEKNEFAQESAARPQTAADVRYLAGLISQLHAAENALMQALLAP